MLDKRRQKEDRDRQHQRYPEPPPKIGDHGTMVMTAMHPGVAKSGGVHMGVEIGVGGFYLVFLMS
ncbi:protein of unknown function [Acidithiobacillus ferrivorans]|uniref:Uncharacterized protein n=2 Tax=Acidithiobacillus ferrivorans TaxID=160808 RepID=A0ABY1MSF6_9PROT|nr:protein of unknown function [Acidithiobacillus ferrivorans]